MIRAVVILCVFAGTSAIPVTKDYYPKSGCGQYGCSQDTLLIQRQGMIGARNSNGFDPRFVGLDGRNAVAAASSAATSGLDTSASASAVAGSRTFAGHQGVIGLNNGFGFNGVNSVASTAVTSDAERPAFLGNAGIQTTAPYNGPIGLQLPRINYPSGPLVQPIPSVQFPTNQLLGQTSGATASATSLGAAPGLSQGATFGSGIGMGAALGPAVQPLPSVQFPANHVFGHNTGASSSADAFGGITSDSSAAASGANIGSGIGIGGVIRSEIPSTFGGPVINPVQDVYYPQFPVVGQNSASSEIAASSIPNGASAASAGVVGSRGFIDGRIIGRTSRINNIVPGRKTY